MALKKLRFNPYFLSASPIFLLIDLTSFSSEFIGELVLISLSFFTEPQLLSLKGIFGSIFLKVLGFVLPSIGE